MSISVVTRHMCLNGDLLGSGNVSVAGNIQGSVNIEGRLTVEASGEVSGNADVQEAWIAGSINGDVRATVLIRVTATGRVGGEIVAPRVLVDPGAMIRNNAFSDTAQEPEREDAPIVDVISQPPQRVESARDVNARIRERVTLKPQRHRVVMKKRTRIKK
jgi:cytoskeletal protein CcmA (bactofilin family)